MWQEALKWTLVFACIALAVLATMRTRRIKSQLPPMDAEVGVAMAFVMVAGYGAIWFLRTITLFALIALLALSLFWR